MSSKKITKDRAQSAAIKDAKTITERERQKVSSTLLTTDDLYVVGRIMLESGAKQSVVLRGMIRLAITELEKKKISTLELLRLGAY